MCCGECWRNADNEGLSARRWAKMARNGIKACAYRAQMRRGAGAVRLMAYHGEEQLSKKMAAASR